MRSARSEKNIYIIYEERKKISWKTRENLCVVVVIFIRRPRHIDI